MVSLGLVAGELFLVIGGDPTVGAAFAPAGDGDFLPADGRGFSGHFDDHILFLLSEFFPDIQKAPFFPAGKTAFGGTGYWVLRAVPFLTGKQKSPAAFPKREELLGSCYICFMRVTGGCALFQLMTKQKGRCFVDCG